MVIGIALGIAIGDLIIGAIGTGAIQVGLVVLLAMTTAVVLSARPTIIAQAGTSAVLVATVQSGGGGLVPSRLVDALVGGSVGIAVLVIAPRNPLVLARHAATPAFRGVANALDEIAEALGNHDLDAITTSLDHARNLDGLVARLRESLGVAGETTVLAPTRWNERGHVGRYVEASAHLELAVRNIRVLARAGVRAVELEPSIPAGIVDSIRGLATAVRGLEHELDHGGRHQEIRDTVLAAAKGATDAFSAESGFAVDVLIGQVRSIAADLLRAAGDDQATAVGSVREAGGERGSTPRPPEPSGLELELETEI